MNLRILQRGTFPQPRVLFLLPSEGEMTAEDTAMLQALYSRDPRPIDESVKLAKLDKAGEFMKRFYIGYNHASIGNCGDVLIAIENVPMIVAKLIQHYQLYRGQECSTRYIDFSKQPMCALTEPGAAYQKELLAFYQGAMKPTVEYMLFCHGLHAADPTDLKAAKAAAFDVLRGFLPCGATTNLSWRVDLQNLNERVGHLRTAFADYFPELSTVLTYIEELMAEAFPNSIDALRINSTQIRLEGFYQTQGYGVDFHPLKNVNGIQRGTVEWQDTLDFASWRDLARHRSVFQTFPKLKPHAQGFETWYIDMLPDGLLKMKAATLISRAAEMRDDPYALPMGTKVPFYVSGPLEKFAYIVKLRSQQTVHPTLRKVINRAASALEMKTGIDLPRDSTPDWLVTSARGKQDILFKP